MGLKPGEHRTSEKVGSNRPTFAGLLKAKLLQKSFKGQLSFDGFRSFDCQNHQNIKMTLVLQEEFELLSQVKNCQQIDDRSQERSQWS